MTDWKEITDPEELFRLKREGWEVECHWAGEEWYQWNEVAWSKELHFRARPPQPKMKKVKMLCYLVDNHRLTWLTENASTTHGMVRIPAEDKEIEVPDDN